MTLVRDVLVNSLQCNVTDTAMLKKLPLRVIMNNICLHQR